MMLLPDSVLSVRAQLVVPFVLLVPLLSVAQAGLVIWASAHLLDLSPVDALGHPLPRVMALAAILAGLMIIALGWFLARRVTRRIAIVAETARLVANGSTNAPMPQIEGTHDLAILAQSLARIVNTLVSRERQLKGLTDSLERQVLERTAAKERELTSVVERLEQLSGTDALTGLSNRRQFNETLAREWQRAQRFQLPISLMLADIDHFKLYNDTFGHQQGDACLTRVGAAFAQTIARSSDLAARYGGEEFGVILTHTDADGAWHAAQRLLDTVRAYRLPHPSSSAARHVTISIGLASLVPGPNGKPEELVRLADEALYEAKKAGRNRAVSSVPEPSSIDAFGVA